MNTGTSSDVPSLIERAKAIILRPSEEWNRIAKEETPSRDIFMAYTLPLASIAPLSVFIGGQLFGYFPFGLLNAAIMAVSAFFLAIISFLALVLIADFLSPKFGGDANYHQCFKLVTYASTPAWIAGIFAIAPSLGVFSLLALYSIYLFYAGTAPLLNVPKSKTLSFTVAVCGSAILLNLLIGALSDANFQLLSSMGLLSNSEMSMGMHGLPDGQ